MATETYITKLLIDTPVKTKSLGTRLKVEGGGGGGGGGGGNRPVVKILT